MSCAQYSTLALQSPAQLDAPFLPMSCAQYEVKSYPLDWSVGILFEMVGLSEEAQALGRYSHEDVVLEVLRQVGRGRGRGREGEGGGGRGREGEEEGEGGGGGGVIDTSPNRTQCNRAGAGRRRRRGPGCCVCACV